MTTLLDGCDLALSAFARGLEPDPNLWLDVWSDTYMQIPKSTGSNEAGAYRTSRTPHAREVMRCLSDNHPCKRVVAMVASQMFKSQVGLNWLMSTIHQSPSNFLWIVPTGKLQKRAAARIDKTIAAIPQIRDRVAKPHSRDAANNNDIKEFVGGALYMVTSGAAANLSEVSARRLVYDEIDRAEANVGGEGDSAELAEARQTTFDRNRKSYYPSSPTIDGESAVQALHLRGTQREALAECIHCGHAQPLDFFRLIMSDDGQRAMYPCSECGGLHEEGDKTRMFARGLWTEGVAGDGETESFSASSMFLPYGWFPWVAMMRQYQKAKSKLDEGDDTAMIVFYNTRLAKTWERSKENTRYDQLMARAEDYRLGTVPMGGLVLTAAIDTQAYRLEMKVVAWGEHMESWVVDYQVIHGDPSHDDTWARADELLKGRYRHASGVTIGISAAFVDSGGTATQDVYNFTAARKHRNVYAVKGHSRPNRPIISGKPTIVDVTWRGKTAKAGAMLWLIGPDTCKDYLQARWPRASGPGAVHFSKDLPESYYKGLTAEYRATGYKRGRKVTWWEQKKGEANEPIDLMNYNLGAAHFLGLHKRNEHAWSSLRARIVPQVLDLFEHHSAPDTTHATTNGQPQPPTVHTSAQPTTSHTTDHTTPRQPTDTASPQGPSHDPASTAAHPAPPATPVTPATPAAPAAPTPAVSHLGRPASRPPGRRIRSAGI